MPVNDETRPCFRHEGGQPCKGTQTYIPNRPVSAAGVVTQSGHDTSNMRRRAGWQCDLDRDHFDPDSIGFTTVKAAITEQFKPNEFQENEVARKMVFGSEGVRYTVAVSLEFDEDFPLQWKFDAKEFAKRLRASKTRTITVTRKGFVEGIIE